MRKLISERITSRLTNAMLQPLGDAAVFAPAPGRLAFTTDSFVVSPLFFPGGDIGSLAVYGTVNDLAVSGARPRWLSLALILEEDLPLAILDAVLESVAAAARRCHVEVVAGDTKVVPRGAADKLFINTSGVGEVHAHAPPGPATLQPGDVLLASGPIGCHGLAVLCAREALGFDPPPASDAAPLWNAVAAVLDAGIPVRCFRDCTRGGLAAVLHEWGADAGVSLHIAESAIPVSTEARGAAELLGMDPLFMACEGAMLAAVPAEFAERTCDLLRRVPESAKAAVIGEVRSRGREPVTITRGLGTERPLDEPVSPLLPRIC